MKKQHPAPPRLAQRFLSWFIRDELAEEVLGDLEEQFSDIARDQSPAKARLLFWYQVLNYLRPFAIRGLRLSSSTSIAMYQHYFKIGWRSLSKEKLYSSIKIGGLAIGIAACLLIALFVQDELSYDSHYQQTDRIYRLLVEDEYRGEIAYSPAMPAPIGPVLSTEFPEIEVSGRLIPYDWYDAGNNQFRPIEAEENLYEEGFAYADPALLEVFEIPMIYGQRESALSAPNTLVLSKTKADKYFPNQDPVGQLVILNEQTERPYTIGGVMEDFPANSHLHFDFLLTLSETEFWEGEQASWCCWNYDSYFRMSPRTSIASLEENLLLIRDNYLIPYAKEQGDVGADAQQQTMRFVGQPISDIHLSADNVFDVYPHGEERIVWLFAMVAGFILLLAMINFINLSTAKSANRAKEVGLRKVVGSQRSHLVRQFLTESVVVSLIAMLLGGLLATLLLPVFNEIAGKQLSIPWDAWWLGPILLVGALFTGLLAGVYPALYLSAFRPVSVLQGNLSLGSKNASLRSILVVLQFTTSIVLIICTLVSNQQMDFLLNKQIGYDKEQVFLIQGANTLGKKQETFLTKLEQLAEVEQATITNYLPVDGTKRDFNSFWKEGRDKIDKGVSAQIWRVDENYL
ncbi:MAG: permease prefix domain 2-containing transporter, partial [Bacteroidota bacterium]